MALQLVWMEEASGENWPIQELRVPVLPSRSFSSLHFLPEVH